MKKNIRVVLSFVLALCMISGVTSFAAANSTESNEDVSRVEPRYVDIMTTSATIAINSSTGKITSKMTAVSREATDTLEVTLILQKLTNGAWLSVKTWEDSDSHAISMSKPYYVLEKGTYRVRAITDVYDAFGVFIETVTVTSAEKDYG